MGVRRTEAFLFTSRESRSRARESVRLALRAGLVRQFGSGLYGFTPTGERIRRNVIRRIEAEMEAIGGQAVSFPQLQYRHRWEQSGRWANFEGEMFTFENRDGQEMCLAPSHEEGIVHLADGYVRSYDDLPLLFYQVGTKHRDDHARNGLLRTKEFTMKDAYSLHATAESLEAWYRRVRDAYERIFDALGVEFVIADAENSVMGGSASEEFVAPVEEGSCELVACAGDRCRFAVTDEHAEFEQYADRGDCPRCDGSLTASEGIEIGHVFKLGTRYSDAMELTIDAGDKSSYPVEMGSYGIGVTRLIQTLIEQHADSNGCRWPVTDAGSVAPYEAAILPLQHEGEVWEVANRLHEKVEEALLFDDEEQSIGECFAESDLLGIPVKIILGNHFRETGQVEIETRDGETRYLEPEAVSEAVDSSSS
ncbi:aminoacyl--tRNA ligase-related protein [Haladaptatus sp. NG-WS-4]